MGKYAKFWLAFMAFAAVVVSAGVLDGAAAKWAACIVSALGAAGVYLFPNTGEDSDGVQ